jgi:predicted Zn-dependent protease with MMP-like domain
MNERWPKLLAMAETEIKELIRALPQELQQAIRHVPISCEAKPAVEPIYGPDDDLGVFFGAPLSEDAYIILFLENIWTSVEENEVDYRQEVRTTLLHELGHYLGLNEAELEERGL